MDEISATAEEKPISIGDHGLPPDTPSPVSLTGWRRSLRDDARRQHHIVGDAASQDFRDAVAEVELLCTQPSRPPDRAMLRGFADWVVDRVRGAEERRYAAAVAAQLRVEELALLSLPDGALVAKLPQLRAEVKRYIAASEPQLEPYLRLLDEVEKVDLHQGAISVEASRSSGQ